MIKSEIERKFLINRSAELDSHCIAGIEIVQTYLVKPDPDIQRRVRSMTRDGVCRYYYTEKKFVSPIERQENEREISAEEYKADLSVGRFTCAYHQNTAHTAL